ncbi:MAG: YraN family protein [Deltaproteobacteria bacterium]|nr:YraN family protein [Deltaproteobacteria bacterium]
MLKKILSIKDKLTKSCVDSKEVPRGNSKDPRHKLGIRGEEEALKFLKKSGYKIITRNHSCRFGEVDIIATEGSVLAFIEVKARKNAKHSRPEEAVNARKIIRITKAAEDFLMKNPTYADYPARFDIVGLVESGDGFEVSLLRSAFDAAN